MRPRMVSTVCLALLICLSGPALAQFPGMPGMGMPGMGMPGMDMGMGMGMPGMGMPGMDMGMGMGQMAAPAIPKWVSPLVPLCWSVGRSQYPGIAVLYATQGQRADLEALINQVSADIEGRFWIKFVDVTADSDPPSFIREVLDPEFRRPKGAAPGAAQAGMDMGMGQPGMGMGGGMGMGMEMGMGAAQPTQTDKELLVAAQKACPAIVLFGKDLFSDWKPPAAGAAPGAPQQPGMGAPGTGMGEMGMPGMGMGMGDMGMGMGAGMGAPGAAGAQATMWSRMDHNFMVYWSFVGRKEMPSPEILRFVLGAVGDPETGINRWALRLKLNREDVATTLELASAYVRALEQGRGFLGQLNLGEDPTRARMVQQNQYIADYLLARAETLRGGRTQVATIRTRQAALAPSFRYEAPTRLVPLLAEHFPGVIAYYRTMDERRRIETLLNAEPVAGGLRAGSYWCKLVDATDEDIAGEEDPVTRLRHEVGVDAKQAPALVLVGQDLFAEKVITLAAVGAPGAGAGMGMGMEMGGMPGMGMGMGMPGGGMAPAAAAPAEKPTDWLRGGGAGAAAGAASAGMGMGMGTEMGGMPSMGGMPGMGMPGGDMGLGGAGGMGAQAGLGLGEINFNDYDYRMPERLARLMVHWSFVGDREMRAVTPQILGFALTAVGEPRGGIDARARALKPRKDEARPTLELGRAYASALEEGRKLLGQVPGIAGNSDLARLVQQNQYMADYMLARAATLRGGGALAREIRAEQEKLVPSFRYSSPNVLTPLLAEDFPGLVGFYRNPAERRRLEAVLDAPAVQQAMSRGSYWCKLIELTDPEGAQDKDLFAMLRSPEVEAELDKRFPALVLCGQDVFLRNEEVVALAAGAVAAPGAGMGMEMGGDMGQGMPGMGGPGMGMPGVGAAPTGAGTMEKPTDWLPDGGFPPTGADVTAQAQVGMGTGGAMTEGMPGMGGMPGMEMGMGAAATVAPGAINLAGYDYRHPNRLARLMQYWLFAGTEGRDAVPAAARPDVLVEKLDRAKAVDDVSRELKRVPDRDDIRLLIGTGKAYLELERHYMSDYFLGRAVKYIEVAEFELRRAGRDIEADTWREDDAMDAHRERAVAARARLEEARAEVRELRSQLLPLFFDEKPTNQIPILLTEFPGIVIYYEPDGPGRVSRRDTPPTPRATDPSRQRDLLERIMAQPAVRELIRDKYWVKWVRVREGLSAWDEGIDAKPPFVPELPAIVLVSGDMFYYRSDPRPHMVGWQVTGGNGMDEADVDLEYEGEDTAPAAAQPTMQAGATQSMDLGMGAILGGFQAGIQQYANAMWDAMGETPPQAAGMGMEMGMPDAAAAPAGAGDDPAAWLWAVQPVGAGPAQQQIGMGGEMGAMPGAGGMAMPGAGGMAMPGAGGMAMSGMGAPMAGAAQARPAGEEPIPGGVIRGESARHGLFCQWADYEHVNQMGRRQGHTMAHLAYVGRNNLPSPPAPPAVSDGVPEARRPEARAALRDLQFAAWMGDGARAVDALRRFMTAVGQDPAATVDIPAANVERVRRALLDMGWAPDATATAQAAELLAKSELLVQQAVTEALEGREEAARNAVALLEGASENALWSPGLHESVGRLVGANQADRLLYPLRVQRWIRRDMAWNVAEWQRQLATVWDINNVGAAAHTEAIVARRRGGDPPQAHNALALARLYVALPGPHMAEYMLARADYLLEKGWEPIPDAVRASAQRAFEQQRRGPAYSGGDELPELYNFVRDMPDTGPYAEAWLALMTAMRREGTLPLPAAAQYVSTTLTAGGDAPAGTETILGRDVPAYFQAPLERLTVEQLQQVRAGMIRAVGRSLPSDHARAAWGRLFHVELELRDRRNISGMDASWREIMSLWRNRQAQAAPYLEVVLNACKDSVREEIKVLRAMNLVDMELQRTAAREPVPQVRQSVDQLPALVEFLKRRPNGQAAAHARYLMAQLLEGSAQPAAAREQLDVLQAMDAPPAWWRWGLVRWERLQRM